MPGKMKACFSSMCFLIGGMPDELEVNTQLLFWKQTTA
jgi:hypothetical protein